MFKSTLRIAILLPMICGICVNATAQRQLTKFVADDANNGINYYELGWDAQNRLSNFKAYQGEYAHTLWNVTITYSDSKAVVDGIILSDEGDPITFTLNNKGLATSYHRVTGGIIYDMEFEYDANGHLTRITELHSMPEEEESNVVNDYKFSWDNGNLSVEEGPEITYGTDENKGNLPDRYLVDKFSILNPAFYAGLLGKPSKYLPTGINESVSTTAISYQLDAEGYPLTEEDNYDSLGIIKYTNKYTYTFSGNGSVAETTNSNVKVYANGNSIEVRGNKPSETVEVFASNGQLFYKGTSTSIAAPSKGLYIVRTAGQAFKVAL